MRDTHGICADCWCELIPSKWSIEEEYETIDGIKVLTGEKHKVTKSLMCPICLKEWPVKDAYEGLYVVMG